MCFDVNEMSYYLLFIVNNCNYFLIKILSNYNSSKFKILMSMADKPKQRLIIPSHLLYPLADFNLRNLDSYSGFQNIQHLPSSVNNSITRLSLPSSISFFILNSY